MQATTTPIAAAAAAPFADMADDLDFAQVAAAVHPFEGAGLGRAPFMCTGFAEGDTNCAFCGTRIRNLFAIKSSDGARFHVGSDCVEKVDADVGGYREQKRRFDKMKRQAANTRRRATKAQKVIDSLTAWKAANSDLFAWLESKRLSFNFAASMLQALSQWGSLTPGQQAACERIRTEDLQRAQVKHVEQVKALEAAPIVEIAAIEHAFTKAMNAGIRNPKLRLGDFVFKPAKASGSNPGAIYVTKRVPKGEDQFNAPYLGKVLGGKFLRVRSCSDEAEKAIVDLCADPAKAAVAHGKRFGQCAVCGRELENLESIERGIGPICAEKYGF